MKYLKVSSGKWHIEDPLRNPSPSWTRARCGIWPLLPASRFHGTRVVEESETRPDDNLCEKCERWAALDTKQKGEASGETTNGSN
jgi:hypothetical protein